MQRNYCRGLFAAACLAAWWTGDAASAQTYGGPNNCAGGQCLPNVARYGYYPASWRRWPGLAPETPGPTPVEGVPGVPPYSRPDTFQEVTIPPVKPAVPTLPRAGGPTTPDMPGTMPGSIPPMELQPGGPAAGVPMGAKDPPPRPPLEVAQYRPMDGSLATLPRWSPPSVAGAIAPDGQLESIAQTVSRAVASLPSSALSPDVRPVSAESGPIETEHTSSSSFAGFVNPLRSPARSAQGPLEAPAALARPDAWAPAPGSEPNWKPRGNPLRSQ